MEIGVELGDDVGPRAVAHQIGGAGAEARGEAGFGGEFHGGRDEGDLVAERDEEGFKVRRDFATSAEVRGLAVSCADQMRTMYASIASVAADAVRS